MTARWTDPAIRKSALTPYGREAESRTLSLLDSALLQKHARPVPDVVIRQSQVTAPRDVRELLPHLEARGAEYAKDAIASLAKRADSEANEMRKILETQRKHLEETVARHQQMSFEDFDEEERRQVESNRRYWAQRLAALGGELRTEPDRIRDLYDVRAQRIEPVGLIYLWPIAG